MYLLYSIFYSNALESKTIGSLLIRDDCILVALQLRRVSPYITSAYNLSSIHRVVHI